MPSLCRAQVADVTEMMEPSWQRMAGNLRLAD